METRVFKDMIAVIRGEGRRREEHLSKFSQDYAQDHWLFNDEPFINDLCLMLLVVVRHWVERELLSLGARSGKSGREISGRQFRDNLLKEARSVRMDWMPLITKLSLSFLSDWDQMQILRELSNSYKHDENASASASLLRLLRLPNDVNYAPLAESDRVRRAVATAAALPEQASYIDIAEHFIGIAERFLEEVRRTNHVSPVKWGPLSLAPRDSLH